MKIEIPDNFFPAPGVPFKTSEQRDLAILLLHFGQLNVQHFSPSIGEWLANDGQRPWSGIDHPDRYRIAPPEPKRSGPFEAVWTRIHGHWNDSSVHHRALHWADLNGVKNFKVHITFSCEEILA